MTDESSIVLNIETVDDKQPVSARPSLLIAYQENLWVTLLAFTVVLIGR